MNYTALALYCISAGCTPVAPADAICPTGQGPSPSAMPQAIGDPQNHPTALAVAGGAVYWLDEGNPTQDVAEGSLVALDPCSGVATILARGQDRPSAIALAGATIYWVNAGRANRSGQLCSIPIGGRESDVKCPISGEARPSSLAWDGAVVWFTDEGDLDAMGVWTPGSGALRRFDPASGAATTAVAMLDAPTAVAAQEGRVAFATAGQGALVDVDGNGTLVPSFADRTGAVETWDGQRRAGVAAGLSSPVAVAQAGGHVYWVERGIKRATGRVARDDGTTIAMGLDYPGRLTVDADDVFVVVTGAEDEIAEGSVSRFRLGASEVDVATSQQLPRAIAVDKHLVYWVDFGRLDMLDGRVFVRWRSSL